ncbi:MAG: UDP-2,3-diacylglucosamine diphosphatase LpxI [Paracoccaceae bacterium]
MTKLAIIAGQGALPGLLATALNRQGNRDWLLVEMEGFAADVPDMARLTFRVERLVPFMEELEARGVGQVCFAGAVRRPRLEPELFDARTAQLVPRLIGAMGAGDDAALRAVIGLFEEFGFEVQGADQIAPDLVPQAGLLAGSPSDADRADVARAAEIVAGLGPLDLGQGAVVAQGLCLAIETLPGTDAMLAFAALHADRLRPNPAGGRGVLFKAPKPGQDRRIDLPALGPDTVRAAAQAGLAGLAWPAGSVLLIDRDRMVAEAERLGLFLWSRPQ